MNELVHRGEKNRLAYEKRYLDSEDNPVWVQVTLTGIRDSAGRHIRTITTVEDIRVRKQTEEALKISEERFRKITEVMPQMVWVTKADGNHIFFNKRWYEYTGLDENSSSGWGWRNVLHPDDFDHTTQVWTHSLATGEPYYIEYRMRRSDGVYRWQLGRALPLKDENGKITQWFGTCTDIEDSKRLSEQLAEAVRYRDEFLSVASHELKTPITANSSVSKLADLRLW